VAMDAGGNAIAVWRQKDGTRFNILANRSTENSDWGGAERLEADQDNVLREPQVAMDPSGNALAAWGQSDGVRNEIRSSSYTPSVGWGRPQPVQTSHILPPDTQPVNFPRPQIAMDPNGHATAVWRRHDDDLERASIWANRYE